MRANKPSIAMAAVLAGSLGCTSSQGTPKTPQAASAECDKQIQVLSTEPGRTVFEICGTPYVAETRSATVPTLEGAGAPPELNVEVKVCDPHDLSNMRVIEQTPNKTVRQMCNMVQISETQRIESHSTVSRPSISAERVPATPVAPKTTP